MTDRPDPDMTAAELALGLLDGEERAAALRRILADPAFAREVEAWRGRMAGLFDDYAAVPAPPAVAERLASPAQPVVRPRWPVMAMVGAIAAALLFAILLRPAAPHTMMVASLMMSDKSKAVPAVIDMTTGEMRLDGKGMAPGGKSAQLWMIGDDQVPQPMGVLDDGPSKMTLPAAKRARLGAGVTLAVSIEPIGGSPTGKPTGPVIASGKLSLA